MREQTVRSGARACLEQYREAIKAHLGRVCVSDEHIELQAERAAALALALRNPGAVLLDDPVGTGKTPIALTVATLLLEHAVEYALVVVPSERIARQWRDRGRMLRHLGVAPNGSKGAARWRRGCLVVTTRSKLPRKLGQGQQADSTLVIVDEAHRGLQSKKNRAFEAVSKLVQGTRLLLVTATPLQISTIGFVEMLRLSSAHTAADGLGSVLEYSKHVRRLLHAWHHEPTANSKRAKSELKRVQEALPDAERALSPHRPDIRLAERMKVPRPPKLRRDLIKISDEEWMNAYHVAQVVPELVQSGKGDMFQRRLVSSSESFIGGMAGRDLKKRVEEGDDAQRRLHALLCKRLGRQTAHPKVMATCRWVTDRVKQKRHVLIFCVFKDTQAALAQALKESLPAETVYLLHQEISDSLRQRFRASPGRTNPPAVLVVRDNLSESIDLDGGNPCVVHHDLPWNPVRLTQRYGRVVRISSEFQPVEPADVFIPILDTEVDRRMFDVMKRRCQLIRQILPNSHGPHEDGGRFP